MVKNKHKYLYINKLAHLLITFHDYILHKIFIPISQLSQDPQIPNVEQMRNSWVRRREGQAL